MNWKWLSFGIIAVVCTTLAGCQTTGDSSQGQSMPAPDPQRATQLSSTELSQGRTLYANKCARCHRFYDPSKYDNAEWHMWMRKMSKKAHLSPSEEATLSKYLDLYRPVRTAQGT
jgi:mono/diheme cytochrome c family protein